MKKVAVIGTGSIGMRHLNVLSQLKEVQPIAIPKRPERLSFLESSGFACAADLTSAVRMGATHCIVATDTRQHVSDGLSALEVGLELLIEKPLAVDATSAQQLCNEAKVKNKEFFIGCVLRFSDSLNEFRKLLKEVGSVYYVHIECQSYLPDWRPNRSYRESYSARADEGGVLRDLIHEIDYATWIFGWPQFLQAKIRNTGYLNIEAEEAAHLWWETREGCLVSICLDYLSRTPRRQMRAYGKLGTLEWDGIQRRVTLQLAGEPSKDLEVSQTRDEMFLKQAEAFIMGSKQATPSLLVTAEDGIKALAICDAARLASKNRKEEYVHYL